MNNVVVIGSQWGDEGKGKIVDWLSEKADVVVRFQGGHNAGHTLVIDGQTFKLHILPSGVVRPGKMSVIGKGVVVDPWNFLKEIKQIKEQGVTITPESLMLAEAAHLILPVHVYLDEAKEKMRGKMPIGTTKRGIGPAYEDKIGRRGVRVCDLHDPELLMRKLESLAVYHNPLLERSGVDPMVPEKVCDDLMDIAPEILKFEGAVWSYLDQAQREGKVILFEGAQGVMLDIDGGTYPFVTSSNTVSAQASIGSGLGHIKNQKVLGITKAYTTRVGAGPFPTEQQNETGRYLGERGHEFGTTTGRGRRCGWFDALQVRYAVISGGIDFLFLTKLDVLDELEELKICVGYEDARGHKIHEWPEAETRQASLKAIYETVPGWQTETRHIKDFRDLPDAAKAYIRRVEELVGVPIGAISVSPEREDTILIHDPFSV